MEQYFNNTGWVAVFSGTADVIGRTRAVEAWREKDGMALVVDPERGCLRAAVDFVDFLHLERAHKFGAVIPGGGWRVYWDDEGEYETVFAWYVSSNRRSVIPLTISEHGHAEFADSADRFIPPERGSFGSS